MVTHFTISGRMCQPQHEIEHLQYVCIFSYIHIFMVCVSVNTHTHYIYIILYVDIAHAHTHTCVHIYLSRVPALGDHAAPSKTNRTPEVHFTSALAAIPVEESLLMSTVHRAKTTQVEM